MQKRILILDDGIGNKDAPQGSRQWAIYFGHKARMRADSARSTVAALQELLHTLKENSAHQAMGYSSWGEFLQRDVLITEEQATAVLSAPASTTVGAALADKARQLKTERPEITQEKIAKAVGCSQSNVSQAKNIRKVSESDIKLIMPAHLKSRNDQADFRKLSADLQSQVISRTISLNRACILSGIRVKLSPLDAIKKAILALRDADWQAVKLWRESQ